LLIIKRKIGEGLAIGEDIRVVVLELRGKHVRLGIEAPGEKVIHRDENSQRLSQENQPPSSFEL